MMTSKMATSMGLSYDALTGRSIASTRGLYHTQLTIPKSGSNYIRLSLHLGTNCDNRTLLATIKQFGAHPCPQCQVNTKDIHCVGTPTDIRGHNRWIRVDNQRRHRDVERAWKMMYEGGHKINSTAVQAILN